MTHTPGPWTIHQPADNFEFDIKAGVYYIAAIPDVPGETEANARLIAAAPEMYAALFWLVDDEPCQFDHEGYCQTHSVSKPCGNALARAALAKAEGRET